MDLMSDKEIIENKDSLLAAVLQLKLPRKTLLSSSTISNKRIVNDAVIMNIITISKAELVPVFKILGIYNLVIEFKNKDGDKVSAIALCSNLAKCNDLLQELEKRIQAIINNFESSLSATWEKIELKADNLFNGNSYIKRSELKDLEDNLREKHSIDKISRTIQALVAHPFIQQEIKDKWIAKRDWLADLFSKIPTAWLQHNKKFIEQEYINYRKFFDTVESSELTQYQAVASLIFDDANLTIAAAGSGKTSVMVAKIGYAISSGTFKDNEIIALAYNHSAKDELKQRIPEKLSKALKRKVKVEANTFHSLGRYLMDSREDGTPWDVFELDSDEGKVLFNIAFNNLLTHNLNFREALLEWVAYARYPEPEIEPAEGEIEEHERRYMNACMKQIRIKKEEGSKSFQPQIPTFKQSVKVRSLQEARIVNWLYLHSVDFEYEKPEWELAKTLGVGKGKNGKQKPYCPDFAYSTGNKKEFIYHEHFGVNSEGKAPRFMGGKKYETQMTAKKKTFVKFFKKQSEQRFFYTTSGDFYDDSVFDKLETSLTSRGIEVKAIDRKLEKQVLRSYAETDEVRDLFIDFISTYRDSGLPMEKVIEAASNSKESYRAIKFLNVIKLLIPEVELVYYNNGAIEFSDMLSKGIAAAQDKNAKLPYKFILVDEFQDSSRLKIELVKAVAKNNKGSVIFFVGDDWQAINRFSGSDIGIFQRYLSYDNKKVKEGALIEKDFRSTHVVQLPDTFRYPQGIADVSKEIILKNPLQIEKPVTARLHTQTEKTIRIVEHRDTSIDRLNTLKAELDRIIEINNESREGDSVSLPSVFILTRNMKDTVVPEGMEEEALKVVLDHYTGELNIKRTTMHQSKGLEKDYTIIAGLDSGFKGFPSEMNSDPLLDLVLPKSNSSLDEERRLLYVALTRSKKQSILLTAAERPSSFISDLADMKKYEENFDWVYSDIKPNKCPSCEKGFIRKFSRDFASCSRYPICGYNK
tara:strand:- start:10041 stop:12983 length:2943 start_codon:yes stop_codon:yes gene_type:complete